MAGRLARLEDGYVRCHLQPAVQADGGRLLISGPGFEPGAVEMVAGAALSGRGLALVRPLSDAVHCRGEGGVSVEFCWRTGA